MTLRDLTRRQLYNLRRKLEKERRKWLNENPRRFIQPTGDIAADAFMVGYDKGLKAGLELHK
jgi:hypothetical protein